MTFAPSPLSAHDRRRRRVAVSLTPLIDVVFILLVFFMLASSFEPRRSIELSATGAAGGGGMNGALLIDLRPDGLRLAGAPIEPEALWTRIARSIAETADQRVLVRPAPGVDLQRTVTLLDRLAEIGVREAELMAGSP